MDDGLAYEPAVKRVPVQWRQSARVEGRFLVEVDVDAHGGVKSVRDDAV